MFRGQACGDVFRARLRPQVRADGSSFEGDQRGADHGQPGHVREPGAHGGRVHAVNDGAAFPPSSGAGAGQGGRDGVDGRPGELGDLRPAAAYRGAAGVHYGRISCVKAGTWDSGLGTWDQGDSRRGEVCAVPPLRQKEVAKTGHGMLWWVRPIPWSLLLDAFADVADYGNFGALAQSRDDAGGESLQRNHGVGGDFAVELDGLLGDFAAGFRAAGGEAELD